VQKISYDGYRFPPEIIQRAIWLYLRFTLSFRDVEDLLAERGILVSYETVRRWVNHFGPMIAADLRKRRAKPYTTWHLDEAYLKIAGRMVYLWRAVDAEGEVLDVGSVQAKQARSVETDAQASQETPLRSGSDGGGRLAFLRRRGTRPWDRRSP
jgi:putative transposase